MCQLIFLTVETEKCFNFFYPKQDFRNFSAVATDFSENYHMFADHFTIENHSIGADAPPFVVAEIGLNHNNNPEIGKKTISAAKKAGANAVKFQSYITGEFIDQTNPDATFLFDIFKKYELSEKDHLLYQQTAKDEGLVFFSTPLCTTSLDFLLSIKVPAIKIASGDIVNADLLAEAAKSGLPILLSTGASDLPEIQRALDFLDDKQVRDLCLLHCVSLYPTRAEDLNLSNITAFQKMTNAPVGFSDHSHGHDGVIAAVALGARVIEKHFTLDKKLDGPDHTISSDPGEFLQYVQKAHIAWEMTGSPRKQALPDEVKGRYFGRRSLYMSPNGKILPLRPDLSINDTSIANSWDITRPKFLSPDVTENRNKPVKIVSD